MQHLVLLMMSKSPVVALLSAQVVRAACHHFSGNEQKLEKIAKSAIIRGSKLEEVRTERPGGYGRSHLHPSLFHMSSHLSRNPARRGFFFEATIEYVKYCHNVFEEHDHVLSLRLTSLGLILNSIFQERQGSTAR